MNQKKRMTAFIGTALLALLAILAWPSRQKEPETQPVFSLGESMAALHGTLPVAPVSLELDAQRLRSASLKWGRDPFQVPIPARREQRVNRPPDPAGEVADLELPQLSGLCSVGETRMAIIGRKIVQRGDQLSGGFRVTEIADDRVTLTRGEEIVVLSIGKDR